MTFKLKIRFLWFAEMLMNRIVLHFVSAWTLRPVVWHMTWNLRPSSDQPTDASSPCTLSTDTWPSSASLLRVTTSSKVISYFQSTNIFPGIGIHSMTLTCPCWCCVLSDTDRVKMSCRCRGSQHKVAGGRHVQAASVIQMDVAAVWRKWQPRRGR